MSTLYSVGLALGALVGGSLLALLITGMIQRWFVRRARVTRLETELGLALQEQEHWKDEYEQEARKRREVTAFIESIQAERETWKNHYLTAGREHGVAQELMMKKIEQLARIAKREVPEELRALGARFRSLHGVEATQKISERIDRGRLPPPEHLESTVPIATDDPNRYPAKP